VSKAARLRGERNGTGRRGAKAKGKVKGKLVFPGFPYEREFTQAELDVVFARMDRIAESLRDAMGPQGWGLGMTEDFLQQIALHQALAGMDCNTDYPEFDAATGLGAFIRPVRNVEGLYVDSQRWQVIKADKPGDRVRDAKAEARARLKALGERAMQDASGEVREHMRELMAEGADWAEAQLEATDDDEPAAKLREEGAP
jgi:hypothetical protein